MRSVTQRTAVLTLVCLALSVIAAWSTSRATRFGEEVPNDVAATLRGGECVSTKCGKESDGQCIVNGTCQMQTVQVVDPNSIVSYKTDCCEYGACPYCGGYKEGVLGCWAWPDHEGLPCDS
jgi:hypothetical protein